MGDIDLDALAEAMVRKQNEAAAKKAADDAEAARVAAETSAKEAAEREERERPAREAAAREQAAKDAAINDVLSAPWNTQFVDADGTVHRKAGPAAGRTFETAGSTKLGQTVIGRWGYNCDNSALGGWTRKD